MRNVVLLCLDSVRKDVFEAEASAIHALADVSFEQCRAASSWSAPSHGSMFTGQLPHKHGVHTYNWDYSTIPAEDTVTADLPESYQTLGVSSNPYACSEFNFDTFFDVFVDSNPLATASDAAGWRRYVEFLSKTLRGEKPLRNLRYGFLTELEKLSPAIPSGYAPLWVAREGLRQIERSSEPHFCFLNFMHAHTPRQYRSEYHTDSTVPRDWTSRAYDNWDIVLEQTSDADRHLKNERELYSLSLKYLDERIASFIRTVLKVSDSETTVIVTADHGENLGYDSEDGLVGHFSSLSEGLLHVPCLLINPPSGYDKTETDLFSHLQLPELIVGLAANRTPDVFRTEIPAELMGVGVDDIPAGADREYWNRVIRAAYTGQSKYVWDSLENTYEYQLDSNRPNWQQLVAESVTVPANLTSMFETDLAEYHDWDLEDQNVAEDLTEDTKANLSDLGYL